MEARTDDDALVARLLARDPGAWEEMLARYGGRIEAACRRALQHAGRLRESEAADAAGETVRYLLAEDARALRAFRPGGSLAAYLHVIARNRTLDMLRRRGPGLPSWLASPAGAGAPDPAGEVLLAERLDLLKTALAALPPPDAEVLRMFYLEGLGYPEIVGKRGGTVEQLGVQLTRARARLRESLGKDFLEFL